MSGKKENVLLHNLTDKIVGSFVEKLSMIDKKRLLMMNVPYIIVFYLTDKLAWLYRHCMGNSFAERAGVLFLNFQMAFENPVPSFRAHDLAAGAVGAAIVKGMVYLKGKNAKKYRQGVEYGSARWGNEKDIAPFIDPVFDNKIGRAHV